jgi:hypothetical protein
MAVDAALGLPEGQIRDQILVAIAGQWASSDAKAAASWIKELPSGKVRDPAMARLSDVLAGQAPELAVQVAMDNMAPGTIRDEKVFNAVREWTTKDQTAALAWVERLPEGSFRDRSSSPKNGWRMPRKLLCAMRWKAIVQGDNDTGIPRHLRNRPR